MLASLVVRRLLIDRDDDGGIARSLRAFEQFLARAHVLPRIKLPPELSLRAFRHLLDRLARVVAEAHRRIRRKRRGAIHARLAVRMQGDLRCRRRDDDRIFQIQIEQLRREIDRCRIDGLAGNEIDPVERLTIAAKVPFAAIAVRGVVVHRLRDVGEHDRLEVERGEHLVQPGRPSVLRERTRIELRVKQRRAGDEAGHARERFAPRKRCLPALVRCVPTISYSSSLSSGSGRALSRPCDRAPSGSACRTCPCSGRARSAPSR